MENNYFVPAQIIENNLKGAVGKANLKLYKMIMMGFFAGMFIAIGAEGSNLAVHTVDNFGLAKTLAGCIFPVGLMMLSIIGAELFTGNCMMIAAVADGRIKLIQMLKNWVVVYLSNLLGSVVTALLIYGSGQFDNSVGGLGAYTIKVAMGKVNMSFGQALCSGILCNILVCAAVLMAMCARDIVGKLFACFFTIMLFVVAGYEHCIANMYYIPAGLIAARNQNYVQVAMDTYGYTADQLASLNLYGFFVKNLVPVTIGNIIGGAVLGLILLYLHGYDKKKAA